MKAITKTEKTATACAPPATVEWHQINWVRVHGNVRRLQARIVQATEEGRWGKVKALQRLLTHSLSGKALAVRRVTGNQGKNTPGIDMETWSTPKAKSQAVQALKRKGYKAQPLRRVYIPKKNGKKRPLGIPTMKDRAMQALHLMALEPIAETKADSNSYGFRRGRSCADAREACWINLAPKRSAKWILEADIKGCFDNINHEWLMTNIPMDKVILKMWLKAGYFERKTLFPTEAGTPQGGIISPVLANMALDGLEPLLMDRFKYTRKGGYYNPKVNMVRYADDFIVTGDSKEILENEVKPVIAEFFAGRGLTLSEEKTKITHIDEGFDFLSKNVRKYNGKLLIKPSKESTLRFLKSVRERIKKCGGMKQEKLIKTLNPIIRGWANYHQHDVSKKTFHKVDHEIWKSLWKWAKRRHTRKGARWIRSRYWHQEGNRNWVFMCEADGRKVRLFPTRGIRIRRHVKIKSEVNPFHPKWEEYMERRDGFKMLRTTKGTNQLKRLWRSQDGKCPICNQRITVETGWDNHHIIAKHLGGIDGNSNRVLLHCDCHRKVHSQKLKVKKPAIKRR